MLTRVANEEAHAQWVIWIYCETKGVGFQIECCCDSEHFHSAAIIELVKRPNNTTAKDKIRGQQLWPKRRIKPCAGFQKLLRQLDEPL